MEKNEKKVIGVEPVKIEYTEKAKFHKKGDKSVVHKMQAEKLVKRGVAVLIK